MHALALCPGLPTKRQHCALLQIAQLALVLSLGHGCASPLAPSETDARAAALVDVSAFLIPQQLPVRTGAHPQSLWWDGHTLTNVKGYDSSQVEQWRLEGDMWRHVYDRTDGTWDCVSPAAR